MSAIDWIYALRVADLIPGSEVKSDKVVFRCIVCGDSRRDPRKKRGALIRMSDGVGFSCKNGCPGSNLRWFLHEHFPDLYTEYRAETFELTSRPDKFDGPSVTDLVRDQRSSEALGKLLDLRGAAAVGDTPRLSPLGELTSLHAQRHDNLGRKYLAERKIDERSRGWLDYRWTEYFGAWAHRHDPEKPLHEGYEPRIVLPCVGPDHRELGCQARAVLGSRLKYMTASFDRSRPLCYGFHRLDPKAEIQVTEGCFDSDALPNAVAAMHGDLAGFADKIGLDRDQAVLYFDNEPGNRQTARIVDDAAKAGWRIAVWKKPQWEIGKDCAEIFFERGQTVSEFVEVHRGLAAELAVNRWRGRV